MKFQSFLILFIGLLCFYFFGQADSTEALDSEFDHRDSVEVKVTDTHPNPFIEAILKRGLRVEPRRALSGTTNPLILNFSTDLLVTTKFKSLPKAIDSMDSHDIPSSSVGALSSYPEHILSAFDGSPGDQFGYSVAISGDTLVVGAPRDDVGSNLDQGSAYVFVRSGSQWTLQAILSCCASGDLFGSSVAIDGDSIVVGAPGADRNFNINYGQAHVFVRSGGAWSNQATLNEIIGESYPGDEFGTSVGISGNFIAIGAPYNDSIGSDMGQVTVFTRSGTVWTRFAALRNMPTGSNARIGSMLSVSGNAVAFVAEGTGLNYFYRYGQSCCNGLNIPSGTRRVSLSGNFLALENSIFRSDGSNWNLEANIPAPSGAVSFGSSISLSGDKFLIGANGNRAAYLYSGSSNSWTLSAMLFPTASIGESVYAGMVAVSQGLAIIGQPYAKTRQGGVSIYDLTSTPCTFALDATSKEFSAAGGTGSVELVSNNNGCSWTSVSNASWISVTSGASGSGNGSVGITVAPNLGSARSGSVAVAGQIFTVNQLSGCSFSLGTTSINAVAEGQTGAFSVIPTGPGCTWTASSNAHWITAVPVMGSSESVSYAIATNTGAARAGTITAAGQTVAVNQAGVTGSIAGTVRYYFGQTPVGIPGVTLSATGSLNVSGTSGSNGGFNVTGFGSGAYTLTPSKTGGAGSAISATDASSVAQNSVGLIQLSPNQMIAADVSGDGTVSALDASRIAQFSVGLTLPSGDQTGTWKFVPGTRSYTSVVESLTGQDFLAILMGDVTGNWFPPQSAASLESSENLESGKSSQIDLLKAIGFGLYAEELKVPGIRSRWTDFGGKKNIGGDVIEIPISIADAMSILAYDAVITYDSDVLEPVIDRPIESNGTLSTNFNVVVNRSEPGKIRLAAYGIAPVTGNGDLLVLRFRVKKPGAKIEDANLRFESLMINEKSVIPPILNRK